MKALVSTLLSVLLALTFVVATPTGALAQEEMQGETADVQVENRTESDTRVYALQGGHMVPLGLVSGMESVTVSLPPTYASSAEPIQLVADFLDSTEWFRSDPVAVDAEEDVHFIIEHDREASDVMVNN